MLALQHEHEHEGGVVVGVRGTGLLVGAGLLLALGCGASGTGPAAGASGPVEGVGQLAGQVEQLGRDHAASFAGLEVRGETVVVYRTPSPQLDAAVRALPGAERVVLRDAPHSARELEQLRARISRDIAHWEREGVLVSSLLVRHDGTAVEVTSPQAGRARQAFAERYGSGAPLVVVEGGPVQLAPSPGG